VCEHQIEMLKQLLGGSSRAEKKNKRNKMNRGPIYNVTQAHKNY